MFSQSFGAGNVFSVAEIELVLSLLKITFQQFSGQSLRRRCGDLKTVENSSKMNDFAKSANLSWNRRLMLTPKLAVTPLRSLPSLIGLVDLKAQTPLV